ncbi:hypothetical protein PYCCODRAFT_61279 [Trametes coccinea BRFM310]|uniref:Uncharacterized protein n=1 Tax=Trametes coccinea (strain BRFM310) TaxID=1353009 RepID=A0A1Y2IVS5_TRAC3|nr:hypothetical protein PYCCODRAFT_61279 [Trametes coccinea BRFM310]
MMYPANPTFVDNADSKITYANPADAHQDSQLTTRAHEYLDSISDAYEGTLAVTAKPGMSFELTFYGRIVQVYGAVMPWLSGQQPSAEYSIDGDPEVSAVLSGARAESNITFYVSSLLPLDFHTLTVTVVNASGDGPFLFDYLVYGFLDASEDPNPPNASSATTSAQSTSSTSSSSSASTSSLGAPAASSNGSSPGSLAVKATFPVVPVVGGVVGGIVLLALASAAIYWLCRRRGRATRNDCGSIEPESEQKDVFLAPNTPSSPTTMAPSPSAPIHDQVSMVSSMPTTTARHSALPSPPLTSPGTWSEIGLDPSAAGPSAATSLSGVVSFDGKEVRLDSGQRGSSSMSTSAQLSIARETDGDVEASPPPYVP